MGTFCGIQCFGECPSFTLSSEHDLEEGSTFTVGLDLLYSSPLVVHQIGVANYSQGFCFLVCIKLGPARVILLSYFANLLVVREDFGKKKLSGYVSFTFNIVKPAFDFFQSVVERVFKLVVSWRRLEVVRGSSCSRVEGIMLQFFSRMEVRSPSL